jgi:hypothetical protein
MPAQSEHNTLTPRHVRVSPFSIRYRHVFLSLRCAYHRDPIAKFRGPRAVHSYARLKKFRRSQAVRLNEITMSVLGLQCFFRPFVAPESLQFFQMLLVVDDRSYIPREEDRRLRKRKGPEQSCHQALARLGIVKAHRCRANTLRREGSRESVV